MKSPQTLTVLICLVLGGIISQIKDDVPVQASSSISSVSILDASDSIDLSEESTDKCQCGEGCQCRLDVLKELQAKYDKILAESESLKANYQAKATAVSNGSSGGGSSGNPKVEAVKVKAKALIVMHTSPTCGPCRNWIRNELPRWKAVGWEVQRIEEETTTKSWPWFEVYEGEARYEVVGPLTAESFARVKALRVGAGVLRGKTTYNNHWSHPGDITQHLLADHGVSAFGMSTESALALHDSIHEGNASRMRLVGRFVLR